MVDRAAGTVPFSIVFGRVCENRLEIIGSEICGDLFFGMNVTAIRTAERMDLALAVNTGNGRGVLLTLIGNVLNAAVSEIIGSQRRRKLLFGVNMAAVQTVQRIDHAVTLCAGVRKIGLGCGNIGGIERLEACQDDHGDPAEEKAEGCPSSHASALFDGNQTANDDSGDTAGYTDIIENIHKNLLIQVDIVLMAVYHR